MLKDCLGSKRQVWKLSKRGEVRSALCISSCEYDQFENESVMYLKRGLFRGIPGWAFFEAFQSGQKKFERYFFLRQILMRFWDQMDLEYRKCFENNCNVPAKLAYWSSQLFSFLTVKPMWANWFFYIPVENIGKPYGFFCCLQEK